MPTKTYWIEEPWLMSADYWGRITIEDLENVMDACLTELATKPVYFVVDFTGSVTMPLRITTITSLMALVNHPNTAGFAFINANRFAKLSIPTMVRRPYRFVDDREAGINYLRDLARADQRTPTPLR